MSKLLSRDPVTGEILREIEVTPLEELEHIFHQAKIAQLHWSNLEVRKRAKLLFQLREVLLDQADDIINFISKESGKPSFEAMIHEVLPALDLLTYYAQHGPSLLKSRPVSLRIMKHRKNYVQYSPIGVVAIISSRNYSFLLPFSEIIMGLLAGNAAIFKPSEHGSFVGQKIQDLFNEAGLPPYVFQTVIGDGTLGAALLQKRPGKVFFAGTLETGKEVLRAASEQLTPVNLELEGKEAMIVLPDADLDFATSAALWGRARDTFDDSTRPPTSAHRIFLHERIADHFISLFNQKVDIMRQSDRIPKNNLTFDVISTTTTFRSVAEVIQKANQINNGLLASILTRNISLAEEISKQLQFGIVTINEMPYSAGLSHTPIGGIKESSAGISQTNTRLYQFTQVRSIHKPKSSIFTFKSPWWFPYTPYQFTAFRYFLDLYRRSWVQKIRALPHFLWHLIKFLKDEKRI